MSSKIRFHAYMSSIDYEYIFLQTNGAELEEISKFISDGKIKAIVDKVFNLEDANEAFKYLESGRSTGKNCFKIKDEKK